MEVGNRIREERERTGMSQEALAREIFVSRQTVSNWETGKTYPDVQSLLLLSNLFGVTVDSLVRGDVEVMEKKLESYEVVRYKLQAGSVLEAVLIVLAVVVAGIVVVQGVRSGTPLDSSPLAVVAIALFVAGLAVAIALERIQRRYDIETVREITAFLDGTDPENIARERRVSNVARAALQLLAGAVAGGVLMAAVVAVVSLFG